MFERIKGEGQGARGKGQGARGERREASRGKGLEARGERQRARGERGEWEGDKNRNSDMLKVRWLRRDDPVAVTLRSQFCHCARSEAI